MRGRPGVILMWEILFHYYSKIKYLDNCVPDMLMYSTKASDWKLHSRNLKGRLKFIIKLLLP